MPVSVKFDVRKLNRKLKTLESKVEKKLTRQALRAGAKIIAKEAKLRAPVDTGELKSKIKVWALKRSRKRIGVLVGTSAKEYTGDQFYAAFVEYGTKDMPAKPFMGPAAEAKGPEAAAVVGKTLADGIEREIAKLRGK